MLKKPYLLAGSLTLVIAIWLLSGYWFGTPQASMPTAVSAQTMPEPMLVQVRDQRAEPVMREIVIQGQVEANRSVTLRAQTAGRIEELLVERGHPVSAGQAVVRIAMDDRRARFKEAEARVHQHERNYAALQRLGTTGYQAESQINEAMADLEAARAEQELIELDIERTVVHAPFAGVLNERPVEIGDVVAINDPIATVVDTDPLVVSAQVSQQHIGQIALGDSGKVRLVTGQKTAGTIRYIAAVADADTRTFRVELEIPNPNSELAVGVSGELRIPLETVSTHFLSPAQLSLDSDGVLGVKTVNEDNTVEFYPVSIVRAGSNGVWVSGLPEEARLITVGQGFVEAGERVRAVPENRSQVADANYSVLAGGG